MRSFMRVLFTHISPRCKLYVISLVRAIPQLLYLYFTKVSPDNSNGNIVTFVVILSF